MNSDHNKPKRSSGEDLTSIESVAIGALLSEVIGGKTPPELKDTILKRLDQGSSFGDQINVAITPASRSQRNVKRHRKTLQRLAVVSGLSVAASIAAVMWIRDHDTNNQEFSVAQSSVADPSTAKSPVAESAAGKSLLANSPNTKSANEEFASEKFSSRETSVTESPVAQPIPDTDLNSSVASAAEQSNRDVKKQNDNQKPKEVAVARSAPAEDGQTDSGLRAQRERKRRLRTPSARLTLVSRSIENNFRDYWKSVGVRPTAQANASEVANRLSVALGVDVPAKALANHNSIIDWLKDRKVRMSISRVWWTQVTGGNFLKIKQDVRKRLRISLARHLKSGRGFNEYLVDLISNIDDASSDFYTSMVPVDGDATHSDMITNLASLTMNVDVSCTRCHDSMIGGSHGQADYWGFAAVINRGLEKSDNQLHRIHDQPIADLFYEDMNRLQRVARPEISRRWVGDHSPVSDSQAGIESISDWAVLLKDSSALAGGVVDSLWKLVHGRPLRGQAAHPMSAPQSDELIKIQKILVDDLLNSDFDIQRTLSIILMSPTTRLSTPESLRDVWATDQSQSRKTAIAFAGVVPATAKVPMATKVEQSMRAIGSISSIADRSLLGQFGDADQKVGKRPKAAEPLAWDFPDQADGPPVEWLNNIKNVDAKIAHLCFLAGQETVPESISRAADAMQKAGVDEPTLLHRVWWMAQGN